MTGILDRIRNTTVADLDKVTGDFSDVAPAMYRPRVEREMVRIVKGADDLKPAVQVPNVNAGMVRTDGTGKVDTRPFKGMPTESQCRFMNSLMEQIKELDHATWVQGTDYMDRMNNNLAWNPARGENASRWIDRLKAKIAELKARPVATTPATPVDDFADVPDGRYAVNDSGPDDLIFVKVTTGDKDGPYAGRRFVKIQASEEFHPIRNAGRRNAILTTIRTVGVEASMTLYGKHIGSCGHCGRTLTNATSRAAGIGPKCRSTMGW
ncbi:MAG: DUF6011 domain-containing protein [Actinoplanes sp.]